MKIQQVTPNDQATLLDLMCESHKQESNTLPQEWDKTKTAINILLDDPQAGEAYFILDEENGEAVGYMIMCRGFSLDYGGYFTWIEETYVRKSEQGRFRDQRFSP
jgi:hypothetical protein